MEGTGLLREKRQAWREVGSLETSCSAADFLSGVEVWVKRPQVVNRRLLGAVLVEGDWVAGTSTCGGARETTDRVFVRELLPRAKSVPPRREAVSILQGETRRLFFHQWLALKYCFL